MVADFPRIITLLRKEKGISQKHAAADLQVSQALLSHYEKGIRECGLSFVVRCADYYGVSCDYLLGRSPERNGSQITVEEIPDPESSGKENTIRGGLIPIYNKKLLANSLNVLYDLLIKIGSKELTNEISNFLAMSVYRVFRVIHAVNAKNQDQMFTVPFEVASPYADAEMGVSEAKAKALCSANAKERESEPPIITSETLSKDYPLFASSLLNLTKNAEDKIHQNER